MTGASALHELGALRVAPDKVHLLLPGSRWLVPRLQLCLHYATDFERVRSISHDGLRLSSGRRSAVELARHVNHKELCTAIVDTIRLRHCTLGQIAEELAARTRFPGRGALRLAHAQLSGELNHSGSERLGRRLLREAGEEVPSRPQPVVHRNRVLAEIDLPFLDLSYGVEIDGPPHLLPEVAAQDRARDRTLARVCGITIDRYMWFELEEEPERFVREVTSRLDALRQRTNPG